MLVKALTKAVSEAVLCELKTNTEEIKLLKHEIQRKDEEILELREKVNTTTDEISQYQRRNCLRIFGIEEKTQENCDQLILDLANDRLNLNLNIEDLDRCHRTGRKKNSKNPRPIIVKFVSYRTRSTMFNCKSKLKGTNITIREDLTKYRLSVLQKAINIYGVKNVWTFDGQIIVKTSDGYKHTVVSDTDLANIGS